ncbi:MAG: type I methionyl aminopeptidase [Phycisphaera sp.]|nr:type I methionyl aminopeptidase [Phycisphaera sp.]
MAIKLKSKEQIEKMRLAGRVVHQVLDHCGKMLRPGVTTKEIDDEALRVMTHAGAKGLFKGYPGKVPFPSNLCISVNEVVVHGIADDRVVKDGDIVGIDCGVELDGWCGDSARTFLVGNVKPEVRRLCEVTKLVLEVAIENIRPGRKWSQVARLMQSYAESHALGVVRDFVGHGIGSKMHEDPKVPNFDSAELRRNDILLREGLVLAIEPMCNLGVKEVVTLDDGWTVVTADRLPSAHYEHTVAVTDTGADVLTNGQ